MTTARAAVKNRMSADAMNMPGLTVALNFMGGTEGAGKVVADLSGNRNDCTLAAGKNAPALTARGLVLTPGATAPQYCTLPARANTWKWAIIAATFDWRAQVNALPVILGSTANCASAFGAAAEQCLTAAWITSGEGFGQNAAMLAMGREGTESNDSIAGPTVIAAYYGTSPLDKDEIFIDGLPASSYQIGQFSTAFTNTGTPTIGSGLYGGRAYPWSGSIQAVLLGTGRPTAAQFKLASIALEEMIRARHAGLSDNTGMPGQAKVAGQVNVVCTGDSIEWGTGTIHGGPCSDYYMSTGLRDVTKFANHAMPASFAEGLQYGAGRDAALLYQHTALRNIVFFQAASNDLAVGRGDSRLGQAIFDANCSASRAYRKLGYMTALVSVLSRGSGTIDAAKNSYNSIAAKQWTKCFDDYVDEAADTRFGADGASRPNGVGVKSTYFMDDNTHVTDAADAILASYRKAHLNAYSHASTTKSPKIVTTSTYTMDVSDFVVHAKAITTITLPPAESWTGHRYTIINNSGGSITIRPGASMATGALQSIGGATSNITLRNGAAVVLLDDVPNYAAGGPAWLRAE